MKPSLILNHVVLRTADLVRSEAFYHGTLGLAVRHPVPGVAEFSARDGGPPLLVVREQAGAPPAPADAAGLFHTAILLPDRPSLAAMLVRLVQQETTLQGLSDHGVSEAIYLADPDGNGVEIYRDRPRADWPMAPDGVKVAMVTRRLNVDSLLAEVPQPLPASPAAGAVLGHVHLSVRSLEASRDFYARELGLAVRQDDYPGALFLAADGYHHHLAVNTWGRARRARPEQAVGLVGLSVTRPGTPAPLHEAMDPDGMVLTLSAGAPGQRFALILSRMAIDSSLSPTIPTTMSTLVDFLPMLVIVISTFLSRAVRATSTALRASFCSLTLENSSWAMASSAARTTLL
jgi:catechol 2,3-dioxygenase